MSLINQMLKDLESRRTPDPAGQGLLQGGITHRAGGFDRRLLLLLSLLIALLALILAYLMWERFTAPAEKPQIAAQAIAAEPPPTPLAPAAQPPAAATPPAAKPELNPPRVAQQPPRAQVTEPQPAKTPPRLLAIKPKELTGSWQPQTLTVVGQNLPRDARIRVSWRGGDKLLPPQRISWRDSEHLAITLTTGRNADTWSVSLDGSEAAPLLFRVLPPAAATTADAEEAQPSITDRAIEKRIRPLRPEQRAEQHYQQGYQLLQGGNQAGAEKQWREALRADPTHIASREGLVGLDISRGRNVEAGNLLAEGLKQHPGYGPFATLYARMQVQNGQLDSAVNVLERAMEAQAQDANFHAFLAALYQRQKAFDKSIAAYQQALRMQSHQGVWWMGIGISLEGAGKTKEALTAYNEAKKSGNLPPKLLNYVEGRLQVLQ